MERIVEQAQHAGLPPIRLHDLRHTWAMLALSAGEHPKVVQERLGHAAIAITLDVYSHVTSDCTATRPRGSPGSSSGRALAPPLAKAGGDDGD
jgi:site-specific recombinase XerD